MAKKLKADEPEDNDIEEVIDGLESISASDLDLDEEDFEAGMAILRKESDVDAESAIDAVPYWARTIKKESLDAVKKAGYIIPELKPRINAKYHVKLISPIRHVKSKKGDFDVVTIENDGFHESLKVNESFKFSLESERQRNNLSYKDLESMDIVFQKKEDGFMVVQINR